MAENAVPKIEGHAAFYAHLRSGRVDEARVIGLENDRFIEKILIGRKYYEAPIITSRICGICPVIHSSTSVKAIESACSITPSNQSILLRKLMLCAQMVQSHSLHLYLLVLPDYVGASSSFELQQTHPELFGYAIKLKKFADFIIEKIGGRAVHPVSNVPGGFKHKPSKENLKETEKWFAEIKEIGEKTVRLFNTFEYPRLDREMVFTSLCTENEFPLYNGEIKTTDGQRFQAKDNKEFIYEELRHYTRAKFGTLKGKEFMVGSISRINLNRKKLDKKVLNLMLELGVKSYFENPFDNIIAQALENYHYILEAEKVVDYFLKEGVDVHDPVKLPNKFGIGSEACEAPRGILFHHYELDDSGIITGCNLITPTVQNLPAMEFDMKKLSPIIAEMSVAERNQTIEMLLRAYDPCITCATH